MEEDINHYKLGNTIQEFEELFGNVPFNDIDKIKKYLFENYIPKSKIQEKIEKLKEDKNYQYYDKFLESRDIENTIDILQELLEKRYKNVKDKNI